MIKKGMGFNVIVTSRQTKGRGVVKEVKSEIERTNKKQKN